MEDDHMTCLKTKHCYAQTRRGEALPCAYCHPEVVIKGLSIIEGLSIHYFILPDGEWVQAWATVDLKHEVV
jgi:hypothetical protein